jgi:hypothetical protein
VQFSQSQCNLIPRVQILIRQDPYLIKLMLCGFLLAQSEGGNLNFYEVSVLSVLYGLFHV